MTITSGGVLPNIHAVHMPKEGAGVKDDKAPKVTKENAADKEASAGARTAMCGRTITNLSYVIHHFPESRMPGMYVDGASLVGLTREISLEARTPPSGTCGSLAQSRVEQRRARSLEQARHG